MRSVVQVAVTVLIAAGTTVFAQDKAAVDRGMHVYTVQKCNVCHSIAGKGNKKGPMDDVGAKLSADEIRQWIVNAPEMTKQAKKTRKPPMKAYPNLPKEDLDGLVAYLQTLKG